MVYSEHSFIRTFNDIKFIAGTPGRGPDIFKDFRVVIGENLFPWHLYQ